MLKIIQRFGKHCSCHLQDECVVVGRFWKSCIWQAVGGELDLTMLIGGAEERAAIQWEKRLSKTPNHYTLLPTSIVITSSNFKS
jgi:hypothetical protein